MVCQKSVLEVFSSNQPPANERLCVSLKVKEFRAR